MAGGIDELEKALQRGPDGYDDFAKILVSQSGASAAVIWDCRQEPFGIVAQHYSGEPVNLWCTQQQHENLLKQVSENRRGAIITNDKSESVSDAPPILIAPLADSSDEKAMQLVELIFASQGNVQDPSQKLSQLLAICGAFERGLQQDPNRQLTAPKQESEPNTVLNLDQFAQFSRTVHESIDRTETCSNVANESRLLTDVDRVSVLVKRHGKFTIHAISGQPSVNRRSNTVKAVEGLAKEVLQTGTEFWFPSEESLPPQIQERLDEYLQLTSTRSIAVLPIFEQSEEVLQDPDVDRRETKVIGGLVFEHSQQQWSTTKVKPAFRLVAEHCSVAIRNSLEHQSLFLYPVWRILGKSRVLTSSRVLPKVVTAAAALLVAVLVLMLWQTPFYVSAEGELLPTDRRLVFPQTEGEVVEVMVKHGQTVRAQEPLVKLNSEDLLLRIEDVNGRLETLTERRATIERLKFRASDEKESNEESLRGIQAEIDSLERQLRELSVLKEKLVVASPIDGQVITWDVRQNLRGRMVTPQNRLMEIADTEGDWQLQVDVADKHADEILKAWERRGSEDKTLRARFSLASEPGQTYDGIVTNVGNVIQLNRNREPVLRVRVDFEASEIDVKKSRTGVTAKLYTGEKTSLGYLWLSDLPDAFRRHVLFYFVD